MKVIVLIIILYFIYFKEGWEVGMNDFFLFGFFDILYYGVGRVIIVINYVGFYCYLKVEYFYKMFFKSKWL